MNASVVFRTLLILLGVLTIVAVFVLGDAVVETSAEILRAVARFIKATIEKLASVGRAVLVFSWWNVLAATVVIMLALVWFLQAYWFKPGKLEAVRLRPPVCSELLDRQGFIFDYLCPFDGVRIWRPLSDIPASLRTLVVMLEDAKFFDHSGLDLDEIINSIETDLERKKFARGASTITQQLAKNLFLSKEKSLTRKASEIPITLRLERELTKDQILELYLNTIEWGDGVYGIEAASRTYFDHEAASLSRPESWLLALMIPNPKELNPWAVPKAKKSLLKRAKTLSRRLVLEHQATRNEANQWLGEFERFIESWARLAPGSKTFVNGRRFPLRWHPSRGFRLSDLQQMKLAARKSKTPRLTLTVDRETQKALEELFPSPARPKALTERGPRPAALVLLTDHSDRIRAVVPLPVGYSADFASALASKLELKASSRPIQQLSLQNLQE